MNLNVHFPSAGTYKPIEIDEHASAEVLARTLSTALGAAIEPSQVSALHRALAASSADRFDVSFAEAFPSLTAPASVSGTVLREPTVTLQSLRDAPPPRSAPPMDAKARDDMDVLSRPAPLAVAQEKVGAIDASTRRPNFLQRFADAFLKFFQGEAFHTREGGQLREKAKAFCADPNNAAAARELLLRGTTKEVKTTIEGLVLQKNPGLKGAELDDRVGALIVGLIEGSRCSLNENTARKLKDVFTQLPAVHARDAEAALERAAGGRWAELSGKTQPNRLALFAGAVAALDGPRDAFLAALKADAEAAFKAGKWQLHSLSDALEVLWLDKGDKLMELDFDPRFDFQATLETSQDRAFVTTLQQQRAITGHLRDFFVENQMNANIKDIAIVSGFDVRPVATLGDRLRAALPEQTPRTIEGLHEEFNRVEAQIKRLPEGDERTRLTALSAKLMLLERTMSDEGRAALGAYETRKQDPGARYGSIVEALRSVEALPEPARKGAMDAIWKMVLQVTGGAAGSEALVDEQAAMLCNARVAASDLSPATKKAFYDAFGSLNGYPLAADVSFAPGANETAKTELGSQLRTSLERDESVRTEQRGTGVCQLFYRDVNRQTIQLGDPPRPLRAKEDDGSKREAIAELRSFCGGDERLLFLLSQIACQNIGNSLVLATESTGIMRLNGEQAMVAPASTKPSLSVKKGEGGEILVTVELQTKVGAVMGTTSGLELSVGEQDTMTRTATVRILPGDPPSFEVGEVALAMGIEARPKLQ